MRAMNTAVHIEQVSSIAETEAMSAFFMKVWADGPEVVPFDLALAVQHVGGYSAVAISQDGQIVGASFGFLGQHAGEQNGLLSLPHEPTGRRHVYNQFVIRLADRQRVRDGLSEAGISTEVYYPVPAHQQPAVASLGLKAGAFPVSERCSLECLALPIYPELPEAAARAVAAALGDLTGCDRSDLGPGNA